MNEKWFCNFCLTVVQDDKPDICQACHVVRCLKCGSWLKEESKWCYGCGTVKPIVEAFFTRTNSIAGAYTEQSWLKRNKGEGCDKLYTISTGYESDHNSRRSSWLCKGDDQERELTEEEKAYLRGNAQ